ncbi:citrate lyase subunit beta [Acrasis kona]|uniref:Citrate lyase subunit beta n=1 Tax=Acrasis kona TaxID=1008807 RepID=A0AAW2YTW8_9EUKA
MIRSLLFVPGNSVKMLNKIHQMDSTNLPDAFVPDLEDSVPFDQKENARNVTKEFLKSIDVDKKEYLIIPRVNMVEEILKLDIEAVYESADAITVGKIQTVEDVDKICNIMDQLEQGQNRVKLIPTIETALGIVNSYSICSRRPDRIVGVAFGADDYAADLGFTRTTEDFNKHERELYFARSTLAVAARAANILSLDTPFVNFKDSKTLEMECDSLVSMGFKGKFAIHPNQISSLNKKFGISKDEYEYAKRVVDAYNTSQKEGRGSTQVDGRMVDAPVLKRCLDVMKMYKQ